MSLNLISNPDELHELCRRLSTVKELAFDTEFIRESTFYPQLEIIQLATLEEAWLIDIQAFNKKELKPLADIFTNPEILKVVHAAHGDQECLLAAMDVLAINVFDTAVGASLCGLGDSIGLGNLMKQTLGIDHPKAYARTNWSKRPLPKPVLEYAILDVKHLIQVAHHLFEKLDQMDRRQWSFELSGKFSDRLLYEVPPEEITKRLAQSGKFNLKDYGILLELVCWREKRVRELNVPRRWLAEDGVLVDLTKVKPSTLEQLQSFRGLSKGELKAPHFDKILQAISKGMSAEKELPPDLKRKNILQASSDENIMMDLLKVCLSLVADEYQIAGKHIVTPGSQLSLVRLKAKTIEEFNSSGLVSPQLGEEGTLKLFSFLKGDLKLQINNGKVELI
jgi:ribonuclease D